MSPAKILPFRRPTPKAKRPPLVKAPSSQVGIRISLGGVEIKRTPKP